jgi:hypothetical protein
MFTKDEGMQTREPSAVQCKRCKLALPELKVGKATINRAAYDLCTKYERKPYGVLWDGDDCLYFVEKE